MSKTPKRDVLALTQRAYIDRVLAHHTALKDTYRLDWLEKNDYPSFERWSTGWGRTTHDHPTLRNAIDFEMNPSTPPTMTANPTPDTSPKAVAALVRKVLAGYIWQIYTLGEGMTLTQLGIDLTALADEIDAQAAAPCPRCIDHMSAPRVPWDVRVERAARASYEHSRTPMYATWKGLGINERIHYADQMATALRAAFPELSPSDD